MLSPYKTSYSLRANEHMLLSVLRTGVRRSGDRAFSMAAPVLWNGLPLSLKSASSLGSFKGQLKTFLFSKAFAV